MRGGGRKGAGRKVGSTKDRVKLGISISRENADWLREQKEQGHSISAIIDDAILNYRASNHGIKSDTNHAGQV